MNERPSSTRLRFARALDVFEAFPGLRRFVERPASEMAPLAFVAALLAARRRTQAVAFLAHTLPRREAVWWGRQCLIALLGPAGEDEAALAADVWVRAPEEAARRTALDFGVAGDVNRATTWLALAAGRSGGSVAAPDQPPRGPAPDACAQAVSAAITLAVARKQPTMIALWFEASIAAGVRFAEGGEAKVAPPARPAG